VVLNDKKTLSSYKMRSRETLVVVVMMSFNIPKQKKPIQLSCTKRVGALKRALRTLVKIPVKDQIVKANKRPVGRDDTPLWHFGIKRPVELVVRKKPTPVWKRPMVIYVVTPKGKRLALRKVMPLSKVSAFKSKIEKKTNIRASRQQLRTKNRRNLRKGKRPLNSYGVKNKDTLWLVARMTVVLKLIRGKGIKTRRFTMQSSDTVRKLRRKIIRFAAAPISMLSVNVDQSNKQHQKGVKIRPGAPLGSGASKIGKFGADKPLTVLIKMQPMLIYIKTPDGNKQTLKNVLYSDSVRTIKQRIAKQTKLHAGALILRNKAGRVLRSDRRSIGKYDVMNKDTLTIIVKMVVLIKYLPSKRIWRLRVTSADKVGKIRRKITRVTSLPRRRQVVTVASKSIPQDSALAGSLRKTKGKVVVIVKERFTVFVRIPGQQRKLMLKGLLGSDPVRTLCKRLSKRTRIPTKRLLLRGRRGRKLTRQAVALRNYGVRNRDTLRLVVSDIKVLIVKEINGRRIPTKMNSDDTVEKLRKRVMRLTRVPIFKMYMKIDGKFVPRRRNADTLAKFWRPSRRKPIVVSVADHRIKKRMTIRIRQYSPSKIGKQTSTEFRIQIGSGRLPDGVRQVFISTADTVGELKRRLAQDSKISVSAVDVLPSGKKWLPSLSKKQLGRDTPTLKSLGVTAGARLTFGVRKRGQKGSPTIVKVFVRAGKQGARIPQALRKHVDCCKRSRVISSGRPTTQSSTGYGGKSGRAVDGNTSGRYSSRSCTHTKRQTGAWWKVQLKKVASICKVVVWNRVDCCKTRLNNFSVKIGLSNSKSEQKCATVRTAHRKNIVQCGCKKGDSVKVQLGGLDYLTLCEVQVYGSLQ
jgi:hypothetical protein